MSATTRPQSIPASLSPVDSHSVDKSRMTPKKDDETQESKFIKAAVAADKSMSTTNSHIIDIAPAAGDEEPDDDDDDAVPSTTNSSDEKGRHDDDDVDNNNEALLLQQAVAEAGLLAYGVLLVEVWVMLDDKTRLHRMAHWLDPTFHDPAVHHSGNNPNIDDDDNDQEKCPLCRLTQSSHPNFVPTKPLAPGEGLPGVLWQDAGAGMMMSSASLYNQRSAARSLTRSSGSKTSLEPNFVSRGRRRVAWRQVDVVAKDPDQPWNPRLQLLNECGLGWVAAVSIAPHCHGIVLFMARESVDTDLLMSVTNEQYLVASAHYIGALYALQIPRRAALAARTTMALAGWRTLKTNVHHLVQNKTTSLQDGVISQSQELRVAGSNSTRPVAPSHHAHRWCSQHDDCQCSMTTTTIRKKLRVVVTKMAGANMAPPPAMSWTESSMTLVGAGMTLYAVTVVSRHLVDRYGSDYQIVLGYVFALSRAENNGCGFKGCPLLTARFFFRRC
jgi:hypothetical protein